MLTARSVLLSMLLTGCVVFEEPISGDAGRVTLDSGGADGGMSGDAGRDAGMSGLDGGMVDGGPDAGMDAGTDAGPPSCVVPTIVSRDNCEGSDIVINEVDGAGSGNADFVEIYNRGASAVDISGWLIADGSSASPDTGEATAVPSGTVLDPNRFIYIWANQKEMFMPGWQTGAMCFPGAPPMCLHSSWGIGMSGDYLYLLDRDFNIVCTLQYPTGLFSEEAFGRVPDGSTTLCPTVPTPGEANTRSTSPGRP
jgi:hypothetical protein